MWVLLSTQPEQPPGCCYNFLYYRNAEPCTKTQWEAVPGQALTGKTDSTATNKRENHCQVQDPQSGMRPIGKSIPPSPRSLSCSIHTLLFRLGGQFTHWDQPQLLAAASVTGRSESQCMSTGSIFLQDKIGSDFSNSCQLKHFWLQIRKKILFSFVLPYRPNWLKSF